MTPNEDILRLADELEALTREESLCDIDYSRAEWSAAGLRELARMRTELESIRSARQKGA